jgi:bis(5'-adenosyl)-triphosphatase
MEETCPFCNPDVVAIAFARESQYYAVYNHAPVVPGHSLIIPFEHHVNVMDLDDASYASMFTFAREVTRFLLDQFGTTEFDMSLQQGENAGQSVEHLHLHIIPRKKNDLPDGEEWYHKLNEDEFNTLDSNRFLSDEELKRISTTLREEWEKLHS